MPFTLTDTDDLQFYVLEISLSNISKIGLFHSNNNLVIFSKTEKKIISQQTCKRSYSHDVTWKGDSHIRAAHNICHKSADSFVFKQKIYY